MSRSTSEPLLEARPNCHYARIVVGVICALFSLQSGLMAQPSKSPSLVNLMPEFWKAWDDTATLPLDRRSAELRQRFFLPHRELYEELLGPDRISEQSLEIYITKIEPVQEEMRALSVSAFRQ